MVNRSGHEFFAGATLAGDQHRGRRARDLAYDLVDLQHLGVAADDLLLAAIIAFVMLTWRSGVKLVERARGNLRQPEEDLIETAVNRCHARLTGTAVFLASSSNGVPLALTQFVKHNHVLHQRVVLVTVLIEESPRISEEDRAEIVELLPGITRVSWTHGFMH